MGSRNKKIQIRDKEFKFLIFQLCDPGQITQPYSNCSYL